VGTTDVTAVTISDATPPNTVYDDGSRTGPGLACGGAAVDLAASSTVGPPAPPAPPAGPAPTAPACNAAGTISVTLPGALPPTQQLILKFGIMINP
jgi:hypothetical protein